MNTSSSPLVPTVGVELARLVRDESRLGAMGRNVARCGHCTDLGKD
jgi:hypothetical protein